MSHPYLTTTPVAGATILSFNYIPTEFNSQPIDSVQIQINRNTGALEDIISSLSQAKQGIPIAALETGEIINILMLNSNQPVDNEFILNDVLFQGSSYIVGSGFATPSGPAPAAPAAPAPALTLNSITVTTTQPDLYDISFTYTSTYSNNITVELAFPQVQQTLYSNIILEPGSSIQKSLSSINAVSLGRTVNDMYNYSYALANLGAGIVSNMLTAPAPEPAPVPSPAPAPAGTSEEHNTPVVVNLDVEISAKGEIKIFGATKVTPKNIVIADVELPVTGLYDAAGHSNVDANGNKVENSMFEFWEESSTDPTKRGNRAADYATSEGRNYKKLTRRLARDLQDVLEGGFDVSQAFPFTEYPNVDLYKSVTDFGNLALRNYAHYLIGHIDATAIITNDKEFEDAMLSKGLSTYPHTAYAGSALYVEDPMNNINDQSASNAKLAQRLVQAIVTKQTTGDKSVLSIVEQVLGQDASRAMDEDNNGSIQPGNRQALRFIPGDVIYMNIKLTTPEVVVASGNNQGVLPDTIKNKYNPTVDSEYDRSSYTLKITLKEHTTL